MNESEEVYVCSFCGHKIRYGKQHEGRKAKCGKCAAVVFLLPNTKTDIRSQLSSTWWVKIPKKLILSETVGPLTEMEFLGMVSDGRFNGSCEVKSPTFTSDEWVVFNQQFVAQVQCTAKVLKAESARINQARERRQKADNENRNRLRKFVKQAVSDGVLSTSERSKIDEFAKKAKFDSAFVDEILKNETDEIIASLIDDALEDGILSPDEQSRINSFARGLKTKLRLSQDQKTALVTSRLAYNLNMTEIDKLPEIATSINLQKKERVLAQASFEWNEIVELKKPKGVWIGGSRYLKSYGYGTASMTTKRVLFDSALESRKATNASIQRIEVFADGILCSRSTGKSLFLQFSELSSVDGLSFVLVMRRILSSSPVQAFLPSECFIPEQVVDAEVAPNRHPTTPQQVMTTAGESNQPRFTFRVVGDHIGDRSYWTQKLAMNEPLRLVREPTNDYDPNAVAVENQYGKSLGYLKRDVVAWFAGLMDRGNDYSAQVLRLRSDGSLIVAVFEW
jgi:DNA-directed RNA polymerase subunit RPC12/RpoP